MSKGIHIIAACLAGVGMLAGAGFGAATGASSTATAVTAAGTAPAAAFPPAVQRAIDAVPRPLRVHIAWQVALDGVDFSPGIIDGAFKKKGTTALSEYAARYFPGVDMFDAKVFQALAVDVDGVLVPYEITAEDAALVGGPLPDDWNAKARLPRMTYESMADCIAEKFHCTVGLLEQINPGLKASGLAVGHRLLVPNVRPFPLDNRVVVTKRSGAAWVSVNLTEKAIRVFDRENNQLALFHCSVAKDKNKLPARDTKVQVIAAPNPNYTFNPASWPEVKNVSQVLTIPPGPRNPVGLAWVGLDLPGYGIHGVPKPEMIGKTGSHGCFRLTNWDALKFAGWVREGMPVKVINPDKNPE